MTRSLSRERVAVVRRAAHRYPACALIFVLCPGGHVPCVRAPGAHREPVMSSLRLNIGANEGDLALTREDTAEITRDVLNREITRRREEESKFRTPKKAEFQIILSTLNIKSELVPKLTDVTFLLMTPNEIEAKLEREGRVGYLVFSEFRVEGSKVKVTLLDNNRSRRARALVSSRSFSYEYSQTNGKWAGKLVKSGMLIS